MTLARLAEVLSEITWTFVMEREAVEFYAVPGMRFACHAVVLSTYVSNNEGLYDYLTAPQAENLAAELLAAAAELRAKVT